MMALLAQVAVEYGALASRNASNGSVHNLVDRITHAVPVEYMVLALGALLALYLLKTVLGAF